MAVIEISVTKKLPLSQLKRVTLQRGSHRSREAGVCAMEAVAWLAGEPHSDSPQCACPVIAMVVRRLNDGLATDAERAEFLRPLLPKLIGSRKGPETTRRRGYAAATWGVRVAASGAMRAIGLEDEAKKLEAVPEITDQASAGVARSAALAAGSAARAESSRRWAAKASSAYADAAYDAAASAYAAAASSAYAASAAASAAAYAYAADADADADADAAGRRRATLRVDLIGVLLEVA